MRGSSGPSTSSRSRNALAGVLVVLHPVEQRVELGRRRRRRPRRRPTRASAATRRVSADSGMRSSRASASAVEASSPRPTSSSARATTASGWPARARAPAAATPRRPRPGACRRVLGLGGQQPGHELAHRRLGLGADEPVDHLAVAQGVHGRDALHLEGLGGLAVGVDVDLGQHDLAVGLVDHLLEDRAERLAGTAPLRPEVDDHGDRLRPLDHLGGERGVGDVDGHARNLPAGIPSPTGR